MDSRQNSPRVSFRHAGGIFPESHISTITALLPPSKKQLLPFPLRIHLPLTWAGPSNGVCGG
jgi:hypothetical protein